MKNLGLNLARSLLSGLGWSNKERKKEMKSRTPPRTVVIGLVGGIATGKSTVLDYLENKGATVINADKLGHEAYLPGKPVVLNPT